MARPREVSDEQILETTRRMVLEHGVGVATKVIAAELGVSAAALFHRFRTKKNLLLSAMVQGSYELEIGEGSVEEVLRGFAESALPLTDLAARTMAVMMGTTLFREILDTHRGPPVLHLAKQLQAWVESRVEEGSVASVDAEAFGFGFTGALMMRSVQQRFSGNPDSSEARARFIDGLVSMHARTLELDSAAASLLPRSM